MDFHGGDRKVSDSSTGFASNTETKNMQKTRNNQEDETESRYEKLRGRTFAFEIPWKPIEFFLDESDGMKFGKIYKAKCRFRTSIEFRH